MIQFTIRISNDIRIGQKRRKGEADFSKEAVFVLDAEKALDAFAKVEQYAEEGDSIVVQREFGGDTFDRNFYPEYYLGAVLTGRVKTRYNKRGYGWKGSDYHKTDETGEFIAE